MCKIQLIALISLFFNLTFAQKPHQRSLVIVFDGTGSMANNLQELKPAAKNIVNSYASRPDKPIYNYVLTVFHDPDVEPSINSLDPNDLLKGIDKIDVSRANPYNAVNNEYPEMAITGLKQSLKDALPNSVIFLISDAPAKDYYLESQVLEIIKSKQVTANFLIEESCANYEEPGCKVYWNLARISSGQFFNMAKNDIDAIVSKVGRSLDPNQVQLMTIISEAAGSREQSIDVDQSIQQVCAGVTGKNPKLNVLGINNERVKLVSELAMTSYSFGCINDTQLGGYKFQFSADSAFTAKIDARSNLKFDFGFSIESVQRHSETNVQPLTGHNNILSIFPSNSSLIRVLSDVRLMKIDGSYQEMNLMKIHDNAYSTENFKIPSDAFKIRLRGHDSLGVPIDREISSYLTAVEGSAPEVTVESTEYDFCTREKVELSCKVKSQIPVEIEWKFEGKVVMEVTANQSKELVLHLEDLKLNQKGAYICSAKNKIGNESKQINLNIFDIPKVEIAKVDLNLTEYLEYSLTCDVKGSEDGLKIQWVDNTGKILQNDSKVYNFTALRHNDEISCQAKNKKCTEKDTKLFNINFLPKFTHNLGDVVVKTLNFGENFEMNCESDRNKLRHNIQWFFEISKNKSVEQSELRDKDKVMASGTNAECIITKGMLDLKRKFEITVNALEPPKVTSPTQTFIFNETDQAELICECQQCLPITKATWSHSTIEEVEIPPFDFSINAYKSFYLINNVARTDTGIYKCKFENSKGSDEAEVKLIVQYQPKIENLTAEIQNKGEIVKFEKKIAILEGNNVNFMCNVEGLPTPKITWNLNSTKIGDQNLLKIVNASKLNEGVFECVAENIVKKTVKKFEFILDFPPKIIDLKSKTLEFTHKTDAEIHCDIDAQPEPTFKWKFNEDEISDVTKFEFRNGGKTLAFEVGEKDEGKFLCEAVNEHGRVEIEFDVSVKTYPTLKNPKNETKYFIKGQPIDLTCEASAFPAPDIKFVLNGRVISNSSSTFHKPLAQMTDVGIYFCVAENNVGKSSKFFNVTINEKPKITSNFVNLTLIDNQAKSVSCEANGIPEPKIWWIFEGAEKVEFDSSILSLNTTNDRGYYKCVANNSVGSAESKFYANIRRLNAFANITKIKKDIKVRENENFELLCPYKNFESLKWTFKGSEVKRGKDFEISGNRLNVKKTKRGQYGAWSCHVTDPKDKFTFTYSLDVAAVPIVKANWFKNGQKLKYGEKFDIEEGEFTLGDNLRLLCEVSGSPKPAVKWLKGNLELSKGIELKLANLQDKSRGVYSCSAKNSEGEVKKYFKIDVESAPFTEKKKKQIIEVKPGQEAILDCSIKKSSPPPNFIWFKNKERLINITTPKLSFKNTSLTDDGPYTCLAYNNKGATEVDFELSVLEPANIIEPKDREILVIKSDKTFTLTCVARGNPIPEF